MRLSQPAIANLCNVLAGIGLAASGAGIAAAGAGALQAILGATGLFDTLRRQGRTSAADPFQAFREQVEANWTTWAQATAGDPGAYASAVASFDTYFRSETVKDSIVMNRVAAIRREVRAECSDDPLAATAGRVARTMLANAAGSHPDLYADRPDNALARTFFTRVVEGALAHLMRDHSFPTTLMPAILDLVAADTQALRQEIAELKRMIAEQAEAQGPGFGATTLRVLEAEVERLTAAHADNLRAVANLVGLLLKHPVAPEQIPAVLDKAEREAQRLQEQAGQRGNDDSEAVRTLREAVERALRDRDLDLAYDLFGRIRAQRKAEALRDQALNEAADTARMAEVKAAALAYRDAAAHYAEAASLVQDADPDAAWRYLMGQARALHDDGLWFNRSESCGAAGDVLQTARALRPKEQFPQQWALATKELGEIFASIGQRNNDPSLVRHGFSNLRSAQRVFVQLDKHDDALMTLNSLAICQSALASMASQRKREVLEARCLERALDLYGIVGINRQEVGDQFHAALLANSIGCCMFRLGEINGDPPVILAAEKLLLQAREYLPKKRFPLEWAVATVNVGNARAAMRNEPKLQEGLSDLQSALQVFRRFNHQTSIDQTTAAIERIEALIAERRRG